jgi:hypothetical protein
VNKVEEPRLRTLESPSALRQWRIVIATLAIATILAGGAAVSIVLGAEADHRALYVVFFLGALSLPYAVIGLSAFVYLRRGQRCYFVTDDSFVMRDHAGNETVLPLSDIDAVEVRPAPMPVIVIHASGGTDSPAFTFSLPSDSDNSGLLDILEDLASTPAKAVFDHAIHDMIELRAEARALEKQGDQSVPRIVARAYRDLRESRFSAALYHFTVASRRGAPVGDMAVRLEDLMYRLETRRN